MTTQQDRERQARYRKRHSRRLAAHKKEIARKYPEKTSARWKVRAALVRGDLTKPKTCSKCGLKKKIVAHHEDYSKPLDVIWFCERCHIMHHGGPPKNHGEVRLGSKSNLSKLTEKSVRQIKRLLLSRENPRNIAKLFKVSRSAIMHIHAGRNWKHVKV